MVYVNITLPSGVTVFRGFVPKETETLYLKKQFMPEVAAEKKSLFYGKVELEDSVPVGDYLPEGQTEHALTALLSRCRVTAPVDGAWFQDPCYVKQVQEGDRRVSLLKGVCWFTAWASLDLAGGDWQVFLKVKRQPEIEFDTDVIVCFNDLEVNTLSAKAFSSLPEEEWTLLELGPFCGPGMLAVKLKGEDCRLRGQNSKYGLYLDQIVAQPS
ncbi:Ank2 [Symbiodinium sp. CCMP2456]|nr:Ank2 [Symbiodinium sp. CCMP2456]